MTDQTEKKVMAFVRTIAGRCGRCLRRSEENCRPCAAAWANSLLRDYESESRPDAIDYSLAARMARIAEALGKAGRPLLSSEIDLSDLCTKQLKRWTLLKMLKRGIVGRKVRPCEGRGVVYSYFLNPTTQPQGEQNGRRSETGGREGGARQKARRG